MLLFMTIMTDTNPPELTDALMLGAAGGDRDAFEQLYRATRKQVYCLLLSIVGRHALAEDLMQETYLSLSRGLGSYQARGKPLAWIFTVAKNLAYMELRRERPTVDVSECENLLVQADDTRARVDALVLQKTLALLGERERQIVMLHAVAGLRFREIAAQLDTPIGTVLSTYHRSLKKLQIAMREEGF